MSDTLIRHEGRAGRITLNRPHALNAVTHDMIRQIEAALDGWAGDDAVACVILDAEGARAFSAGGDIASIYAEGRAGNVGHAHAFWRDEYRVNAKIARYPKPVISFLHGFVMGGGVGVGCHASLRVAGESLALAMPEVGIGLVPDVGGSFILSRTPGRFGEYLATTATRMDAGCAIAMGFADLHVPEAGWDAIKDAIAATGGTDAVHAASEAPGACGLLGHRERVDRHFAAPDMGAVQASLDADPSEFARETSKALGRVSPLAAATALDLIRQVRRVGRLEEALALEYRATSRAIETGDFLEGIRAAVIDKDRTPRWRHESFAAVSAAEVARNLAPREETP